MEPSFLGSEELEFFQHFYFFFFRLEILSLSLFAHPLSFNRHARHSDCFEKNDSNRHFEILAILSGCAILQVIFKFRARDPRQKDSAIEILKKLILNQIKDTFERICCLTTRVKILSQQTLQIRGGIFSQLCSY